MDTDTIVAIATPPGRGGVAMVRLSGTLSYDIARRVSKRLTFEPKTVVYTSLYAADDVVIDSGLVLYFNNPHSFTGEDVIEFHTHGSPIVLDQLIQQCVAYGARLARPGEFSERAFLNDKMDLTQAEAIADLIHANTQTAARMAVRSLQGDFSKVIHEFNQQLIALRLYVEAAIDFPEEEIDFLSDGKVSSKLTALLQDFDRIKSCASQGSIIREGLSVVIAGRPNAGKSTLINQLSGRDLAIVTDIAGTTRDVMREYILLDDIPVHIVDTAGLRDSSDCVEQEGIKRAWQEVSKADCILLVIDKQDDKDNEDLLFEIKQVISDQVPIITIFNKIDLVGERPTVIDNSIYLSAKSGDGLVLLKNKIKEVVGYQPTEGIFLARRRHIHALDAAHNYLLSGQNQLNSHRAGELLAEDLRLAHQSLCEITGEFTSDDLLGEIFSSFCIGK